MRTRSKPAVPDDVRAALLSRARGRCERCGRKPERLDPHHRKQRSLGGTDDLTNLIALDRLCHERVHTFIGKATSKGWLVASHQDPATVPVVMFDGTYLLERDGGLLALP